MSDYNFDSTAEEYYFSEVEEGANWLEVNEEDESLLEVEEEDGNLEDGATPAGAATREYDDASSTESECEENKEETSNGDSNYFINNDVEGDETPPDEFGEAIKAATAKAIAKAAADTITDMNSLAMKKAGETINTAKKEKKTKKTKKAKSK